MSFDRNLTVAIMAEQVVAHWWSWGAVIGGQVAPMYTAPWRRDGKPKMVDMKILRWIWHLCYIGWWLDMMVNDGQMMGSQ